MLVDDAHWLDGSSAQALLFAFRRLVADPIAVLIAVREGDPSLLDGADLPTLRIGGLTSDEAATLLGGLAPAAAERLHGATAGNPLALLELAPTPTPATSRSRPKAPRCWSRRGSRARSCGGSTTLDEAARRALVLVATSDSGDLADARARRAIASRSTSPRSPLAESAGLVTLRAGTVEFRHPLARSAIYADAPADQRRDAHRALAAALPDRDVDRRAWHLAAAAVGHRRRGVGGARAGRRAQPRPQLVRDRGGGVRARRAARGRRRAVRAAAARAAEAAWLAGLADRAGPLLDEARGCAPTRRRALASISSRATSRCAAVR